MTRLGRSLALLGLSFLLAAPAFALEPSHPSLEYRERQPQTGGWSVSGLLALASAYQTEGQGGHAVLALERAKLLAPRSDAVQVALVRAREMAGVFPPAESGWKRALGRFSPTEWAWAAFGAAVMACLGLLSWAWTSRRAVGRALLATGIALGASCVLAGRMLGPSPADAVVLMTASARIAPAPTAEATFSANAGISVRIAREHDGWVYVRAGDEAGWLPSSSVERVLGPHTDSAG